MPALSFQAQFAHMVESGEKLQTIRAHRKRPFRVGDRLYLYSGMRTKQCRKLGEAICTETRSVRLTTHGSFYLDGFILWGRSEVEPFARRDGFANMSEMVEWFETNHGLPFDGQLVRWDKLEPAE